MIWTETDSSIGLLAHAVVFIAQTAQNIPKSEWDTKANYKPQTGQNIF